MNHDNYIPDPHVGKIGFNFLKEQKLKEKPIFSNQTLWKFIPWTTPLLYILTKCSLSYHGPIPSVLNRKILNSTWVHVKTDLCLYKHECATNFIARFSFFSFERETYLHQLQPSLEKEVGHSRTCELILYLPLLLKLKLLFANLHSSS